MDDFVMCTCIKYMSSLVSWLAVEYIKPIRNCLCFVLERYIFYLYSYLPPSFRLCNVCVRFFLQTLSVLWLWWRLPVCVHVQSWCSCTQHCIVFSSVQSNTHVFTSPVPLSHNTQEFFIHLFPIYIVLWVRCIKIIWFYDFRAQSTFLQRQNTQTYQKSNFRLCFSLSLCLPTLSIIAEMCFYYNVCHPHVHVFCLPGKRTHMEIICDWWIVCVCFYAHERGTHWIWFYFWTTQQQGRPVFYTRQKCL
jgi:hypothetical protein